MANRTNKGRFAPGASGNPGGRPKLPGEMREMFQAKAPEAFEVLCKHLHANDAKVSVTAAKEILDRAYGRPLQSIDANINEDNSSVRYYVEVPRLAATTEQGNPVPKKAATTEEWPAGLNPRGTLKAMTMRQDIDVERPSPTSPTKVGSVSKHAYWVPYTPHPGIERDK